MMISIPQRESTYTKQWEYVRSTICSYLDSTARDGLSIKYQLLVYSNVSQNKVASFIADDCIIHVYKVPVLYDNEYDIELECKSESNKYIDDLNRIFA